MLFAVSVIRPPLVETDPLTIFIPVPLRHAVIPVILRSPEPPAANSGVTFKKTPLGFVAVPHETDPVTLIVPFVVV
jgi:hypothetical protein